MLIPVITAIILNTLLALGAVFKKAITLNGALTGFAVGFCLYFFGGPLLWLSLLLFFVTGTLFGKIKVHKRNRVNQILHKTGTRDWIQVAANGSTAGIMAIIYGTTGNTVFLAASFAALAGANADTWASELGVLSSFKPRSILTWKKVEPGISGGITLTGTSLSAAGSFLIGTAAMFSTGLGLRDMILIGFGGFAGSLCDSILGAGLQGKYTDSRTGEVTERPEDNTLVSGKSWMTNDLVNFLSITFSSVVVLVLSVL